MYYVGICKTAKGSGASSFSYPQQDIIFTGTNLTTSYN